MGARFGCGFTVTEMLCVALKPSGSEAVTVTVADPSATGVMLTLEPDTLAVALLPSEGGRRVGQTIAIGVTEVTANVYCCCAATHRYRLI